ncbi:MAG: hypothetical protein FWC28_07470 [Proteobacteria bacterium]|nr:hypothetical protein [Cystobacterineae bacterium]MCL2258296.1 hypothetical protein [Cystobacterineae bacterium]MCL2315070.1 hypothetical protein [Pseudomonadota bacterium]
MNPLAELTRLTLIYFPLFALFILAGSLFLRFSQGKAQIPMRVSTAKPCPCHIARDSALVFGLLGVVLLHVVCVLYALLPGLFPPLLLGFWELVFLAAWAGLTFGALGNALSRGKAWRAGDATQVRPASYYALLALTGLSGMGMAVCCRWTTTWLWPAWKSWLVSALSFSTADMPGLLFAMPLAAPACLLLVVVCCVVWPASGLSFDEVFPFRSLMKRLRQNTASTSSGAQP